MWMLLQSQYKGSGAVLNYNAIEAYTNIKYAHFANLEQFVIGFKKSIDKLAKLEISPPTSWHPIRFIMALSDAWPIWAERQRSNTRNPSTKLTLSALIEDITDEARNTEKKADGSSAMYGGKPNSDKKKPKDNRQSKDKDKDKPKREPKLCKGCKNPKALHTADECYETMCGCGQARTV